MSVFGWAVIYNLVLVTLACGLSTGFYIYTGSLHSFWWMALLWMGATGSNK